MQTCFRRSALGLALVFSLFILQSGVAGTNAQDVPSQIGPFTPQASACTVDPRTADELLVIFATASPVDPVTMNGAVTIVMGEPADPVSAQHVTSTIHQAFACLNAGDYGRFLALMSEQVIITNFPWVAEMLADEASAAEAMTPQPPEEEYRQTILGIGSIAQLPDGRYSAVVVGIDPSGGDAPFALYLVLAENDGIWLIDEAVEFDTEL
jgi:hypothetical protein